MPVKNPLDEDLDQDSLYHRAGRTLRHKGEKLFWSNDEKIPNGKEKKRENPDGFFTNATRVGYIRVSESKDIPQILSNDAGRLGPQSHPKKLAF